MIPAQVSELIAAGALFVANHSGGKDSQAMLIALRALVPARQILIAHAVLDEVEWEGSEEHIRATAQGLPIALAQPATTFFQMVERRGMFPSASNRQCTSDLKRGPIEREVRRYLRAHPEFGGLVVNCMGMRAQESASRSRLVAFKRNDRNSVAGRTWFDWLPIHDLSEAEVFAAISGAGQSPHWVYASGMTRKSCCFCIMASARDLVTAARLKPELYRRYVATERRLNFTLQMGGKTLPEITGIAA